MLSAGHDQIVNLVSALACAAREEDIADNYVAVDNT